MSPGARGCRARCVLGSLVVSALLAASLVTVTASPVVAAPAPSISAPSAAVFEASTGQPVFGRAAGQRRLIASTTKMMTALVTVSSASLTRVCTAPPYAALPLESQIGLRVGEQIDVHDLLQAVMLPSANDAAAALAVCVAGSRGAFVARMNQRAKQLGLLHTHFTTPIGLDAAGNYSTAADLVRLAIALRGNGFLRRTMDLPRATLHSGVRSRTIVNRNTLVLNVPWVDGVKTGHTNAAGYILVGVRHPTRAQLRDRCARRSERSRARRRRARAAAVGVCELSASRRRSRPVSSMHAPQVQHRPDDRIDVVAASSVRRLVDRGARVRVTLSVPDELAGPLPKGTRVGTLTVRVEGRPLVRVPLLTRQAVPEVGPLERAGRAIARPGSLVAIVAMLGGAAALLARRRGALRRRRADMEAAA